MIYSNVLACLLTYGFSALGIVLAALLYPVYAWRFYMEVDAELMIKAAFSIFFPIWILLNTPYWIAVPRLLRIDDRWQRSLRGLPVFLLPAIVGWTFFLNEFMEDGLASPQCIAELVLLISLTVSFAIVIAVNRKPET